MMKRQKYLTWGLCFVLILGLGSAFAAERKTVLSTPMALIKDSNLEYKPLTEVRKAAAGR
jgi:hypothetical protein